MICRWIIFVLAFSLCSCLPPSGRNQRIAVSPPSATVSSTGAAIQLFVAPDGDDHWSGKAPAPIPGSGDGPFATLEAARAAIRKMKLSGPLPLGGATVWIRGGKYFRDHAFVLGPDDGGTSESPVVYANYPGEVVRMIGGREVEGFVPVRDPGDLSRLNPAARQEVRVLDLTALGITHFGAITNRGFGRAVRPSALELFFKGTAMPLARWPNSGWELIEAVPAGRMGGRFSYSGNRPARWAKADDVWLHGYWSWDWADSYERVQSIDVKRREIATAPPHSAYGYKAGQRFYAFNLLEELDAPGEWYLDRKSGRLFFWPPSPPQSGDVVVSLLEDPLIRVGGAQHVTFRGLTLEDSRGAGVVVDGGGHNLIEACTLRNLGTVGVVFASIPEDPAVGFFLGKDVLRNSGKDNGIKGCQVSQTGEGGLILGGGDRKSLTAGNNFAVDNRIQDFSRWVRTLRSGVLTFGVGNRVEHNLISDAPHLGVLLYGNDHLIQYNEFHHLCLETKDAGGIYLGRDPSERGNIVRYNYFHDFGRTDIQAVYLDDCACGTTVLGNLFVRIGMGVKVGGGRDNTIENNIFFDCPLAVFVDARGLGWGKKWFDGTDPTLVNAVRAVNPHQAPFNRRYPQLARWSEDEPQIPKGNRIARNIVVGGEGLRIVNEAEPWVDLEDNFLKGDPRFMDSQNSDFRLRPDSPAWGLGFKPLPLDQIGPFSARRD